MITFGGNERMGELENPKLNHSSEKCERHLLKEFQ